ncbi:MAG: cysteine desulfurase [Candidatus Roizmanbacteria bacterium]|nr:cysteine desulfurase [Candidatus Roizmanbacteria bacterium]
MNLSSIRRDFPVFKNNKNLTYLDSAATALKPRQVIDAVSEYYSEYPSNVFRGLYPLSQRATEAYESARGKVAQFIHAHSPSEIIFTRGTTESVNFIAYAWGRLNISKNDEIVTTIMEHHSNFIPWQELAKESGAVLKIIDIDEEGKLSFSRHSGQSASRRSDPESTKIDSRLRGNDKEILEQVQDDIDLKHIVTKKTKLVAITHVSNVLGTINPIKQLVKGIKKLNPNCLILIDGAQAVPHMNVDVQDLGCDFYAFSGHKMMGPTGIGVLWIRKELLEKIAPFHFGGSMIEKVTLEESRYAPPPQKFEAGTPNIAGAIGLGAAIEYMNAIGIDSIRKHEMDLTEYVFQQLHKLKSVNIYGTEIVRHRGGVISFNLFNDDGTLIHPHDVGDILGKRNICLRAGHHCAMPLAKRLGIPASVRISLHIYNNKEDIDRLIEGLEKVKKIFK